MAGVMKVWVQLHAAMGRGSCLGRGSSSEDAAGQEQLALIEKIASEAMTSSLIKSRAYAGTEASSAKSCGIFRAGRMWTAIIKALVGFSRPKAETEKSSKCL